MSSAWSFERAAVSSDGGQPGRAWSRAVAIGLVLVVVGPLVGGAVPAARQSSIDSCTTIDAPGVYTLSENLASSAGVCIQIAASDVRIDGAGNRIHGDGDGIGIRTGASGLTNVTVSNVTVSNWTVGVQYRNVTGGEVENVTAVRNREGIALRRSRALRVTNNVAWYNDHQGIRLLATDDSTVAANSAAENVADGFLLRASTGNALRANVARRNGDEAGADGFLIVDGSDGIDVRRNRAINNTDDGIDLKRTNNTTVVRNVASRNVNDGILLAHVHYTVVRGNVANNNSRVDRAITDRMLPGKEVEEKGSDGITLRSNSTDNTLVRNTANGNERQGIRLWLDARGNTIVNNTASDNGADGIAVLNSSGNDLTRNLVRGNDGNGIHLDNGVTRTDVYRNRVRDNRLNGILIHTANDTTAVGNAVTGNGRGPDANGIRVGQSTETVLLNNPTYANEGGNVRIVSSGRVWVVESGGASVTDSDDVTVVHSWLVGEVIPTARGGAAGPPEGANARTANSASRGDA